MLAIFAEEAAVALASELAPYAAGEAALAASSVLGAEALMGLGAEALGTSALGGAEAALGAEAMAANAASGGAGAGAANINAAQVAAQQNAAMQMANSGITSIPEVMSPAQQAYMQASSASATPGIAPGTNVLPAYPNNFLPYSFESSLVPAEASAINTSGGIASPALAAPPSPPPVNTMGLNMPGTYVPEPMYSGMGMESQIPANQFIEAGSGGINSTANTIAQANVPVTPPSGLEAGFDKAIKFAEKNPFTAMTLAYTGANALGLLKPTGATFNDKPYDGPLSRYRLSPNFQGRTANPADFQYRGYAAGGGIMGAGFYDIPVGYDEGGPVTEAQKDAAKQAFELANPGGLGPSVNVGGYGTLNFKNDAAYDQFNQNPQSMTFSQGPGGVRYVEPKAADYDTRFQNLSMGMGSAGGGGGAKPYDDFSSQAYAKGGSLSDSIESYQKMLGGQQQAAPASSRDVGIYYDQDPDTRYQDALTAAQIRQAKVNQRAYVSPPAAKRPTPLGQLKMPTSAKSKGGGDVEAAAGGIMQSSLGGYAAGGNPRLLKGPGDGMSDNIPATINGRQPARLADGEFVIPADVVSHLGNGSTEAGAKQLHAMMDKVRKARTGNPKQGKQINPRKYMPK
jgi:hypothetical protein